MSATAIAWFEIPATDLERAGAFYTTALDAPLGEMNSPAGMMKTFLNGEAPIGGIVSSEHNSPSSSGPLVYFGTDDIEAALARIAEAGGQVVLPKTSIGAFGHIAQFVDSEGNRVALHSA